MYFGDTDLCFVDTFSGLVPGKVVGTELRQFTTSDEQQVIVRITATRPGFRRGDRVRSHVNDVIDRRCAYVRDGKYRISTNRVRTSLRPI